MKIEVAHHHSSLAPTAKLACIANMLVGKIAQGMPEQ